MFQNNNSICLFRIGLLIILGNAHNALDVFIWKAIAESFFNFNFILYDFYMFVI